jgi:hypothetical protein
MAEALRSNGGKIGPAGIAGTSDMIHRLLFLTARLLKVGKYWKNAGCFRSLCKGMRFI